MAFVVAAVFVVLALIVVGAAVKVVPQGYEFTVERFGRYTRTLQPGIAILTPFAERVGRKMSLMEQVLAVPPPGGDHQGQRHRPGRRHRLHPGHGRPGRAPTAWPTLNRPSAS